MGRSRPVIRCSCCAAWLGINQCCRDGKKGMGKDGTCIDARPREIGSCSECFWIGIAQEQINKVARKSGIVLHNCDGDARCNSGIVEINLFFMGKMKLRVTDPKSQGGPYWLPKKETE